MTLPRRKQTAPHSGRRHGHTGAAAPWLLAAAAAAAMGLGIGNVPIPVVTPIVSVAMPRADAASAPATSAAGSSRSIDALDAQADVGWMEEAVAALEAREYEFSATDTGWSAPNRIHGLRATLAAGVLKLSPREAGGDWSLGYRTTFVGRTGQGGGRAGVDVAAPKAETAGENSLSWTLAEGVEETWTNDPSGLEFGWVLQAPPGADGTGRVLIEGRFSGLEVRGSADGSRLEFLDEAGRQLLTATSLLVTDADGKSLAARMDVQGGLLRVAFDDSEASYPVTVDPLLGAYNVRLQPPDPSQNSAFFGSAVAGAGDVNGDGYDDVLVGAPEYDNGETNEGAAFLFYGGMAGVDAVADWFAESNQGGASLGASLASLGDLNGDGYDDIVIGAQNWDNVPLNNTNEGAVFVWLGGVAGPAGPSGNPLNAAWMAESLQSSAQFGNSVAGAGDVNGDTLPDLVVGSYLYASTLAESVKPTGAVFVWFGGAPGPGNLSGFGPNGTPANADWYDFGNQDSCQHGISVAGAGDVNGDDVDEIIVGANLYDNGEVNEGRAHVYYGPLVGPTSEPSWNAESNQAAAQFGQSVAGGGDVNCDGYDDVFIGAPIGTGRFSATAREGWAGLWYGGAGGLGADGTRLNAGWTAESNQSGSYFGWSVALLADVNCDGCAEVMVGAPRYTSGGKSGRGGAFQWDSTDLATDGVAGGAGNTPGFVALGEDSGDQFGTSVANAGDVNDDGSGDAIVGAPFAEDPAVQPQSNEGHAFVYTGVPITMPDADGDGVADGCDQCPGCNDLTDGPPMIACPANVTIDCMASTAPAATGTATASDDCATPMTPPVVTYTDTTNAADPCNVQLQRTWTATDACGHVATCVQTITLQDLFPPTLMGVPMDVTVTCNAVPMPGNVMASDNCDMSPNVTYGEVRTNGACPDSYTLTRTWKATDDCLMSASGVQVITVQDTTAPMITCPAPVTIECGASTLPGATGSATASDDGCSAPPLVTSSDSVAPGGCPQESVITRTWTAMDACGNSSSCVQTITVDDTTAPMITCPMDVTVECGDATDSGTLGAASASDNCGAPPTIGEADAFAAGCGGNTGVITRTWTATDDCGNSATCAQTITIVDTTPPALTLPSPALFYGSTGFMDGGRLLSIDPATGAGTLIADVAGLDRVHGLALNSAGELYGTSSGDLYRIGPATGASTFIGQMDFSFEGIAFDSNDVLYGAAFGSNSDLYTIDVTTAAVTSVGPMNNSDTYIVGLAVDPTDGTLFASGGFGTDGIYTIDTSTGALTVLGTTGLGGSTPDIAFDEAGNLYGTKGGGSGGNNNLISIDKTTGAGAVIGPIGFVAVSGLTGVPAGVPITIECGESTLPANTGTPTVTDDCDAAPVVTSSDSVTAGDCPQESVITRTWTATDACGNSASVVQTIRVEDTQAPTISCPADATVECLSDVPAADVGSVTASDNCDGAPVVTHEGDVVASPGGSPPGDCGFDHGGVGCSDPACEAIVCSMDSYCCDVEWDDICADEAQDLCVPALGPCVQQVTRTYRATDACGNSSECEQVYTVIDTTAPMISCPSDVTVECGNSTDPPATGTATGSDNCGDPPTVEYSDSSSGACGNTQVITRTWTATDECGNSSSCAQTITVVDSTAPMIACPANVTVECGQSTASASTGSATASDVCDPAPSVTSSDSSVAGCGNTQVITRTWTATDACGNSSTCAQTVTVVDTTPPMISCPAAVTVACADTDPALAGMATASDTCGTTMVTYSDTQSPGFDCCTGGTITRTWTATDACNNASTCVQTITVPSSPVIGLTKTAGTPTLGSLLTAPVVNSANVTTTNAGNASDQITTQVFCTRVPYTLTVTNACGGTATGVELVDDLPEHSTVVLPVADGGMVDLMARTITWPQFSIGPMDSAQRTFTIEVCPCLFETTCTGGLDEDLDGLADCADPDCANDAACIP